MLVGCLANLRNDFFRADFSQNLAPGSVPRADDHVRSRDPNAITYDHKHGTPYEAYGSNGDARDQARSSA